MAIVYAIALVKKSNNGNSENKIGQVGMIDGNDSSRKTQCIVIEEAIALTK